MQPNRNHRTDRPRSGVFHRALAALAAVLLLAAAAGADDYDLGFVDRLSGPDAAAGAARFEALSEAVRRFELSNDPTRVRLVRIDFAAGNSPAHLLETVDAAVFGSAALLDELLADDVVVIDDVVNVSAYSDSIAGLLDTATAFVEGSVGIAIGAPHGGGVDAARFVPPAFADLTPRQVKPGDTVMLSIGYGSYGSVGSFFAEINGTPAVFAGPELNLDSFELYGYTIVVPPDASSGLVRLEIPSTGTPSVSRVLVSPEELLVEEAAALPAPAPLPAAHCDSVAVVFKRLGSPNFFSEVADSKDVVIADYENDGVLDVFVPQTLSHPDTEYKGLGNDAAGLPSFATIASGLLTNDITGKREYGASAGDIDNDGDLDIVPSGATTQGSDYRVRLLINNGNISFTNEGKARISNYDTVATFAHSWDEISLADVDGDNDLDVAMSNRSQASSGRSAMLLNTGGGFFDAYPDAFGEPASEVHHDVHFCDVDNDGDPDVLLSQDFRGPTVVPLQLRINNGDGNPALDIPPTFSDGSSRLIPNPAADAEHVACQDFNNDGRQDIHVGVWFRSDRSDEQDQIFLNNTVDSNGNGTIELGEIRFDMVSDPDPSSPAGQGFKPRVYSAAYGDFTGDGKVDIIVDTFVGTNKGPYLMCNIGNGTFKSISPTGAFWRDLSNTAFDHFNATSADVADLNGDGKLDVVFGLGDGMNGPSEEANRIYVLESVSGGSGGGGGGGGCLQAFKEIEPCFEIEVAETDSSLNLGSVSAGDLLLTPLAGLCGPLMECAACGTPYLTCERFYNVIFDFAAAGFDPRMADVRLHDFEGKLLAVGKNRQGQKIVSFKPRGRFREGGLDQEVFVVIEVDEGASGVEVPVRLEVSERPLVQ